MAQPPSYLMICALAMAALVSLAALFRLFLKHLDGQPLLAAQRRRSVPWTFLAPLVLMTPLALAFGARMQVSPPGNLETATTAATTSAALTAAAAAPAMQYGGLAGAALAVEEAFYGVDETAIINGIWVQSTMTLTLAAACLTMLTLAFGATRADLGLPASWPQFFGDVKIGAVACAAALVPVYAIQWALSMMVESTEEHPLIEQLIEGYSPRMAAAVAFSAVVAAPVYEETAFRLVLQGWLERLAMRRKPEPVLVESSGSTAATSEACRLDAPTTTTHWGPIAVSGALFGLAHWGYGVSPAALALLGFVLGYVYQRTHRIAPCIACHMLFNGLTLALLAVELAGSK